MGFYFLNLLTIFWSQLGSLLPFDSSKSSHAPRYSFNLPRLKKGSCLCSALNILVLVSARPLDLPALQQSNAISSMSGIAVGSIIWGLCPPQGVPDGEFL
tara:strand:+ start:396 stop:695 length:300 start_codon:yes stop_codon:yes gene_type:complete